MASRAIWAGSVTFGMVVVPVQLHMAVEGKDAVSFKQVRRSDGSQIKLKRVAAADGAEVAYADIAKAYEWGDQRVIFDDDDMASLPLSTSKQIQVQHFTDPDDIDVLLYGKSYYVIPASDSAAHAYRLLASQMAELGKVGVVKVAIRQHESVAVLRPRFAEGGTLVLVLTLLSWPDEVRPVPHFFVNDTKLAERRMARELIEAMTEPFDPSAYTNDYRAAVEALAEAKVAGTLHQQPASEAKAEGMSLMDSLAAAVAAAKEAKK